MNSPHDDVELRAPVWEALGEFFLDNEPNLEYVIRVCSESHYSLKELDQILFGEVWPVLSPNLVSMAGEWAGWDREWLSQRVLAKRSTGSSKFWWLNPAKLLFCSAWLPVRKEIEKKRSNEPAGL